MKIKVFLILLALIPGILVAQTIKVATFNVSMEATNYQSLNMQPSADVLAHVLASGQHPQVRNIAEIIQRVDPDIILLNEFDYIEDKSKGVDAFVKNYLNKPQSDQTPVNYPYTYVSSVNTGKPSPFDLDNNGKHTGYGGDAYGYGLYPGHYGMALLSKFPIDEAAIRTFQHFKWQDMPHARAPRIPDENGNADNGKTWYSEEEWAALPLSSKSHWDIPIKVGIHTVHILAMHPTPPTFDGDEDRNGKRNADEIRLMADYLTPEKGAYVYDDSGAKVSLAAGSRFVLVGDFNAADMGDKHRPGVIEQLLDSPLVNGNLVPVSAGGAAVSSEVFSNRFTAYWGARADYVLPSQFGIKVIDTGVFWPEKTSGLHRLVNSRDASSDHRLVWAILSLH
ncbi:endonuclease/exonuclease/phosphatase family protein [Alteromonas sp. D210916BOD_24]|uniref:endonuclease/exonuclease/phosphatase family protein n=1 Tax=Alteromonas sp. D210916BOD_24 TaxID=3157618 RepID=UPI00399CC988